MFSVGLLGGLATSGCSIADRNSPTTSPSKVAMTAPATQPTSASRSIFMVHEASLPAGVPAPGPIGEVIVKNYPACREATVTALDAGGKGDDRMFMTLFDHIQKRKVSMTSPVVMDFAAAKSAGTAPPPSPPIAMSFFYGSREIGQAGTDGKVTVHDIPPMTVLSVGVRGRYDAAHFEIGMRAIDDWMAKHPQVYEVAGTPRFLGYNSPFVPWFLRYGEVQVPVRADAGKGS
jgi:hypothetical protein